MRRPLPRTPVSKIDLEAKAAARRGTAAPSAGPAGEAEGGAVGVWARLLLRFALDVCARGREAPWNPTATTRTELNTGNELPGMPFARGRHGLSLSTSCAMSTNYIRAGRSIRMGGKFPARSKLLVRSPKTL